MAVKDVGPVLRRRVGEDVQYATAHDGGGATFRGRVRSLGTRLRLGGGDGGGGGDGLGIGFRVCSGVVAVVCCHGNGLCVCVCGAGM